MKTCRVTKNRSAFTLIEVLIVIVIMGFLVAIVAPRLSNTKEAAQEQFNESQMKMIKKGALEFYGDVGFAPDNVSLLTYGFEKCFDVTGGIGAVNYNNAATSDVCRNMISFIDRHYTNAADLRVDATSEGDNGTGTQRKQVLIDIIKEKLNPDKGGWKGGYIAGNGYLKPSSLKALGGGEAETGNLYFVAQQDIELYKFDGASTLWDIDTAWDAAKANAELYPVYTPVFDGTMNSLYENARNRKEIYGVKSSTMLNAPTVLDPYGTPYEIQIPTSDALAGVSGAGTLRAKYARIVSFGPDRRRDTSVATLDIDYTAQGYDDSVLYLFDNGLSSFFYNEDR
ncbi:MAG: prepilin-type N-terminal cleavage/methylation domain-containing protein [Campylobacterales bacterium]|nr:prepilin-type N-terminal cleavage/methylation domain-containing protein [Campylobacterales bacterium]